MRRLQSFSLLVLWLIPICLFAAEDDKELVAPQAAAAGFMIEESNFDQWIFQGSPNADVGKARIRAFLNLKVDELSRICQLTSAQKQKLMLAGQGDIKRFLDQVEVVRKKFLKVQRDQEQFNQIWQDISPLQQKQTAGLFGTTSFLAKTINTTLTDAQSKQVADVENERNRYRFQSAIDLTLVSLESSIGLNAEQHEELAALLLEGEPPLKFGQQDAYYVMYVLAKLPAQKLRKILTADQLKGIQPRLAQGRGMEQFLVQNGIIKGGAVRANPGGGIFGALFGGPFGPAEVAIAVPAMAVEAAVVEGAIRVEPDAADEAADPDEAPADALVPENRPRNRRARR